MTMLKKTTALVARVRANQGQLVATLALIDVSCRWQNVEYIDDRVHLERSSTGAIAEWR